MKLTGRGAVAAAVQRLAESRARYERPSIRRESTAWAVGYLLAQRRADARREAWAR